MFLSTLQFGDLEGVKELTIEEVQEHIHRSRLPRISPVLTDLVPQGSKTAQEYGFHISQHSPRKLRQEEVLRTSCKSLQLKPIFDALVPANSFLPGFFLSS